MSVNDPVSDLVCRVNNAQSSFLSFVDIPYSKLKYSLSLLLKKEGYIKNIIDTENDGKKTIRLELSYHSGLPVIRTFKRISKPGKRIYSKSSDIPKGNNGLGTVIVSTPKGLLTDYQARADNVGGELICEIF